jgi:hypothetical protein
MRLDVSLAKQNSAYCTHDQAKNMPSTLVTPCMCITHYTTLAERTQNTNRIRWFAQSHPYSVHSLARLCIVPITLEVGSYELRYPHAIHVSIALSALNMGSYSDS